METNSTVVVPLDCLIDKYKDFLLAKDELTEETSIQLTILQEEYSLIAEQTLGIHYLNKHLMIDDSAILKEFFVDLEKNKKGYVSHKADVQHYKTITEKIISPQVDFSTIYTKYLDCTHPYVLSQFAHAFCLGKYYDIGLHFLQKALEQSFSFPNIYWHNTYGIYGCTESLHLFQYLLGRTGMSDISEWIPDKHSLILRFLYLLLSRAICMCDCISQEKKSDSISDHLIKKMNYLSIRADLVYDYSPEFLFIMGPHINPDIQFISDKYLAYDVSIKANLEIMAKSCFFDSLKMYRYGDLKPNSSGGYQEIEDATWFELIERGAQRSDDFAQQLMREYKSGAFYVTPEKITNCMNYLYTKMSKQKLKGDNLK